MRLLSSTHYTHPVPISIANADGRRRKSNKGKLKQIIDKYSGSEDDVVLGTEKDGYVLDVIAKVVGHTIMPSWKLPSKKIFLHILL